MKTRILMFIIITLCLLGCSSVNSVEPFDDQQAQILAKKMVPKNVK